MTDDPTFDRLLEAVIARTGHAYYRDKEPALRALLASRMKEIRAPSPESYLEVLEDAARGEPEWRAIEDTVTIKETYFFRYADQFEALAEAILPELIRRKALDRSLRIWSIGCANGAEPYSVAILLRRLLGDAVDDWRIALVGGDISEAALREARAARFRSWALRTLTPAERAAYFDQLDDQTWALKPIYRRLVRFERQNILDLVSGEAPLQWVDFDLILCRNVLIYFSHEQARELAAALRARLAPGSVLLLGHAEATIATDPAPLPSSAPTVVGLTASPLVVETPASQPLPFLSPPAASTPAPKAPATETPAPAVSPAGIASLGEGVDAARALADLGSYDAARSACRALIARAPAAPALHYLDALIALGAGDLAAAEAALRRALYLDRSFAAAHYRLGLLRIAGGRGKDGRRSLVTAARLAEALPPDAVLDGEDGLSAGELAAAARLELERSERPS